MWFDLSEPRDQHLHTQGISAPISLVPPEGDEAHASYRDDGPFRDIVGLLIELVGLFTVGRFVGGNTPCRAGPFRGSCEPLGRLPLGGTVHLFVHCCALAGLSQQTIVVFSSTNTGECRRFLVCSRSLIAGTWLLLLTYTCLSTQES